MKKKVILRETEKITAFRPSNFFADQLVYARNQHLRQLMEVSGPQQKRIQEVSRFGGVQFLEDMDCRNVQSVYYVLESIQHPLFWITGGKDAALDYSFLLPIVVEKVRAVIGIGADNSRLRKCFSPYVEVYDCRTMDQAVKTAYYSADNGDVVLFSTPCASDTCYADAGERSIRFREAVADL